MPSASSPVKDALESYVAGRVKAERLVIALAAAYYGAEENRRTADGLRPLIDVIDRASPGIVELGTAQGGAGFAIRLVERPFPKQYEAELRRAAQAYLAGPNGRETLEDSLTVARDGGRETPGSDPGLLARLVAAVRRLFSASA
jgi:hypothetical protein